MPLFDRKVKFWSESRPNIEGDLDDWYEEIKRTHTTFIQAGKVGYDDRTKLFHVSGADGWNEWIILSYNQNRIMLNLNSNRFCAEPIKQPSWASEPIKQPSWTFDSRLQFMQNQINNMSTQIQNMQAMLSTIGWSTGGPMLDGGPPTMGPFGTGCSIGRPRSIQQELGEREQ